MTTLAEIERAVDRLPLEEQEELLCYLGTTVRRRRTAADPTPREVWMARQIAGRESRTSNSVIIAEIQGLKAI